MGRLFGHLLLCFFLHFTVPSNAADILQNPSFEIPPANLTGNSTPQFLLLHQEINSIPGWSFNGTVYYVTAGGNLSFPGNGSHAIQLGENGKIKQGFKAVEGFMYYILSFTLMAQDENCSGGDFTAVNISVRGPDFRSHVFFFDGNSTRKLWQSFGFYLGAWGSKYSIDLEIRSWTSDLAPNVSCWPIVDDFFVKRIGMPMWYDGNSISNGGFEIGPVFVNNSSEGMILKEEEEDDSTRSPLQGWKILGQIRYIDSKHFKVPRGKAAIELISDRSGIEAEFHFHLGYTYSLNFTLGDANNSCVGDLLVFLQIRNDVTNFTLRSEGIGSAFNHSVTLGIQSKEMRRTSITFYIVNETRATDGALCGPVLDNISLYGSNWGGRGEPCHFVVFIGLFLILAIFA